MADAPNFPAIPQTLGRYELLLPVARGGMGQVWAGRLRGARGFNKIVAVKTLLPIPGSEGRLESMLLEEARIASLIHHPNVVQTLELGEHESTLYLVMEWVDGEPLSYIVNRAEERGGLPLPVAVNLIGQTLLGLHAAHELTDDAGAALGVVHRDVSPHNVLVTYSGVAKLVDFGIAKAMNQHSSSTEAGEVKGKFSYMAPEQIRCETVDRRADVFAMGILLYTLTARRHPFKTDNPAAVVHQITSNEAAPRPSLVVSGYSRTLEAVVMKALDKVPERRWQSAEEMLGALQRAVPLAFTPEIAGQVKDFLGELIGDRAALRREGLRRAQLAADVRFESGSLPAVHGAGQSASSLGALSIDNAASAIEAGPASSRSARLTLPAPKPASRRASMIGAVAAVLLCAGVFLSGVLTTGKHAEKGAAPAFAADGSAKSLPARSSRPTTAAPAPSARLGVPQAAASAATGNALAPSQSANTANDRPGPVSQGPLAPAPPRVISSAGVHKAPTLTKSARPHGAANGRDLIAPDYAR